MAGVTSINRWKLVTVTFVATACMVAGCVFFFGRASTPTVQIVRVTRAELDAYVHSNGIVEPTDPQIFRAQTQTFIDGVFAKEGESVRRGKIIVSLNPIDVPADLAKARLALLTAQDNLRRARAGGAPDEEAQLTGDLSRAQLDVKQLEHKQEILAELFANHASTQEEVDQNSANLSRARVLVETLQKKLQEFSSQASVDERSAELQAQRSQDQIQLLQHHLTTNSVIAPFDGVVYSIPVRQGDYVRLGDPLASMADLRKMRVRAFVDEADLGDLRPNLPVTVTWEGLPNKTWTGRTEEIPKQVVGRGTRSVGEVLCSVDNTQQELLPNINVDVRILARENSEALVIPREAVHTEQSKHFVFMLHDDRLQRRDISIGIASSSGYEVLSGLDEGDELALSNSTNLHDGMLVHAEKQP